VFLDIPTIPATMVLVGGRASSAGGSPGGATRMHGVAREMVGGLSAVHGRAVRAGGPCRARLAPRAHGWPRLTIVGRALYLECAST